MEQNNLNVPYIVYESSQARQERTVKRLIVIIIILITMLFACNAFWLYEWCQYDYSSEQVEVTSEGEGNANYIGRDLGGGLYNGESESYASAADAQ